MRVRRLLPALLLLCSLAAGKPAGAYSLLTHEQLIDLTWQSSIVPLLLSRYPTLTPAQLEHARAYAYGGCVIQDIGYYPLGDAFFSDLTHYVRTGDFIVNLFRNAGNADELAFAIGALSHYIGDTVGHATATNLAVPVEFPRLAAKYGSTVNYAEGEHQHVQTEFAFDIYEIPHSRMAPIHYLRQVGLEVPVKQVSLAFYQTYGLREDFSNRRAARVNVSGYRFAVHHFIPRIAFALTVLHRKHEPAELVTPDTQRLDALVKQVGQQNDWARYRKHAGPGTYALAAFIYVLPKVGALKLLAVKGPTPATRAEYIHSVLASVDGLNGMLKRFTPPPSLKPSADTAASADKHADSPPPVPQSKLGVAPAVRQDSLHPLPNRDLDTGNQVKPAGYPLTDDTYALLLHRLAATPKEPIPPGIKSDIENYYLDPSLPYASKKIPGKWQQVQTDLVTLETIPTSTELNPFPTYDENDMPQPQPPAP